MAATTAPRGAGHGGHGTTRSGRIPTLDDRFDETLRAAREGADEAWAAIYRDMAPPLLGYLRAQRAPEPEDVIGEVLLQVVRDLDQFSGDEAGFRAWVFTIAHRRLIDARRSSRRRPAEPAVDEDLEQVLPPTATEPEALRSLATDDVLQLLDRLSADQREVLVLRVVAGLRGPEIAAVTGRDVEAVKGLSRRGLARLRTLLHVDHRTPEEPEGDRPPPDGGDER